ncbi:MAG: ABC transporter permease [bacterium]|nr:ABC transporter permease [bacterium]MDZ4296553.1 ABC transporter permease [Patescibacteria group bacterium]
MPDDNPFRTISDIIVMTKRNLLRYRRLPQLVAFSTIQPVMFVLLFAYVFGGAINIPGVSYIDYLLPGILVQTVLFGSIQTGVGLAEDVSRGMINRFRSLPMARSAVLAGRTITESLRNVFVVALMVGVGMLIGFRIEHGYTDFLLALGLTILFGFAFSWVSAAIGMTVKNVEAAQVAGFIWVFPLAFASSIFVPISTMPKYLKTFAEHNPITYIVNTVRALALGTPVGDNALWSLLWIAAILIVFVPLAVNRYRKIS